MSGAHFKALLKSISIPKVSFRVSCLVRMLYTSRSVAVRGYAHLFKPFYSTMTSSGPIETAIKEALTENLQPIHLDVINESYMHNVPKGSETHFKVLVVSEKFENLPLIKRHRMVNDLVKMKLEGSFVHALSIEAKIPSQWNADYKVEPSPNCKGGFGK